MVDMVSPISRETEAAMTAKTIKAMVGLDVCQFAIDVSSGILTRTIRLLGIARELAKVNKKLRKIPR
jgi:hypothetical protein